MLLYHWCCYAKRAYHIGAIEDFTRPSASQGSNRLQSTQTYHHRVCYHQAVKCSTKVCTCGLAAGTVAPLTVAIVTENILSCTVPKQVQSALQPDAVSEVKVTKNSQTGDVGEAGGGGGGGGGGGEEWGTTSFQSCGFLPVKSGRAHL